MAFRNTPRRDQVDPTALAPVFGAKLTPESVVWSKGFESETVAGSEHTSRQEAKLQLDNRGTATQQWHAHRGKVSKDTRLPTVSVAGLFGSLRVAPRKLTLLERITQAVQEFRKGTGDRVSDTLSSSREAFTLFVLQSSFFSFLSPSQPQLSRSEELTQRLHETVRAATLAALTSEQLAAQAHLGEVEERTHEISRGPAYEPAPSVPFEPEPVPTSAVYADDAVPEAEVISVGGGANLRSREEQQEHVQTTPMPSAPGSQSSAVSSAEFAPVGGEGLTPNGDMQLHGPRPQDVWQSLENTEELELEVTQVHRQQQHFNPQPTPMGTSL